MHGQKYTHTYMQPTCATLLVNVKKKKAGKKKQTTYIVMKWLKTEGKEEIIKAAKGKKPQINFKDATEKIKR